MDKRVKLMFQTREQNSWYNWIGQNWFGLGGESKSFENENFELSIKYLEKNIVFHPKSSESYILLGKSYSALENSDKAEKYFKIAYTLIPENIELNYLLGKVSYNLGLIEEYADYLSNLEILCPKKCDEIDKLKKLSTE